jgi:ubiquinone/menaquinone biosynthesis C-methylase UbiE
VIGIDAAPKMIDLARLKASESKSNAKFAVGISEALDFEDNQFDMVVNSMFTHHIDHELKKMTFSEKGC